MYGPLITVDAITRWLVETTENMTYLEREGLMRFLEETMKDTFKAVKNKALKVIESGEPQGRIPVNVGNYARRKAMGLPLWSTHRGMLIVGYRPTTHGLGVLSGGLYQGVQNTPIGSVRVTRGKELRIDTKFRDPSYIADVHDGVMTGRPRPFLDVAAEDVERILVQKVEEYLATLDIVVPPSQFISTLISRSPMEGVVDY